MVPQVNNSVNKDELVKDSLSAVNKFLNLSPGTDILDEVFVLLGNGKHSDTALQYEDVCVDLLAILADPGNSEPIKKKMGNNSYGDLIRMLSSMRLFCKAMNDDTYEALLTAYQLKKLQLRFVP